ncbi:hypothetical protein BDV59DRAFT_177714 [Aspergillus ambiguus]|uniref:uncharacterized protein n=1 Tax=Aspergillus ambiguus TaxID=176160 RepID=UPI003CCD49E3
MVHLLDLPNEILSQCISFVIEKDHDSSTPAYFDDGMRSSSYQISVLFRASFETWLSHYCLIIFGILI